MRYHARVLKIDLQSKTKGKIAPNEPIMPWLVRWAAMAVSRYPPGKDGRTPYERQTGRAGLRRAQPTTTTTTHTQTPTDTVAQTIKTDTKTVSRTHSVYRGRNDEENKNSKKHGDTRNGSP